MDSQVGLRWVSKSYVILNENRLRRFFRGSELDIDIVDDIV